MLNKFAFQIFQDAARAVSSIRCAATSVNSAQILDAGVECSGSLEAGILLARICLGDRGSVALTPADPSRLAVSNAVQVRTDQPVLACLGSQYAGWPVQTDDFFAMGSGPMRMARGREAVLSELGLAESVSPVVGVLESDSLPTESAIELIADQCGVETNQVAIAVAPTTSIAGSIQVVARSVETAMHKLHELNFDTASVISGTGQAPLPPPAKPGDTIEGIGRTNDAMLYGATVALWLDHDDDAIDAVADQIPSSASDDYGEPFAKIFKRYDYDFYKVDPMLFSPAQVILHNLRSGRTWTRGQIDPDVLRQSFFR